MKLHTMPASPNSVKVMAVAAQVGLPLEIVPVDLTKGESKTPEFMKMNLNGKIPVLVDGDFTLWESNAIIQYLAMKAGNTELWPSDPRGQSDVNRWMCWSLAHWTPALGTLLFERMIKAMLNMGPADPKKEEEGEMLFKQYAQVLDQHMQGRQFLVGDHLTLADYAVATPLMYAEQARLPWAEFKNVQAYWQRISQVEWIKKATPPMPVSA